MNAASHSGAPDVNFIWITLQILIGRHAEATSAQLPGRASLCTLQGLGDLPMLTYVPFDLSSSEALVQLLTCEVWPFHPVTHPDPDSVRRQISAGDFSGASAETFWILAEGDPVGIVRLFDLDDPSPMFDLRLKADARNRGYGRATLAWLTLRVFSRRQSTNRVEATTRQDNWPMRRVLRYCGYVKEAHYRDAWDAPDGRVFDSVGYAILRRDWAAGTVTTPNWADEA